MRMWLPWILLISTVPSALCQQNSPLTDDEKRRILGQLFELESCREECHAYEEYVARDREQDAREKENCERALELERQATALAEKERDLAQEKAALYEDLYRSLKREPGIGCWLKRIFTLGIARCR